MKTQKTQGKVVRKLWPRGERDQFSTRIGSTGTGAAGMSDVEQGGDERADRP